MVEIAEENTLNLKEKQTEMSVVWNVCSNKVNKLLDIDLELDKDLVDIVLKARILDFLLSWSKKERIEKQIVFFSTICSNILENYQGKLKENTSCTYILNKYKPWKYASLAYLFKRDKPIWKDNLSFFLDEILKNKNLLNNSVIDFRNGCEVFFQTDENLKAYNIKLMPSKILLLTDEDKDKILMAYSDGEFIEHIKPKFLESERIRLNRLKKLERIIENF